MQRLMSIRDRANSVSALRLAPPIVEQMVEDVLAQTSAAHSDLLSNPITGYWQNNVFAHCGRVANGRFPFVDGVDSDMDEFAILLGPGGLIERFFRSQLEPLMDAERSPWRWKPEARFAGLSPESAVFFQRALAITDAYFDENGNFPQPCKLQRWPNGGRPLFASVGLRCHYGPRQHPRWSHGPANSRIRGLW
jgi:type VI protein secretion system component VasK